ncbi:SEC-C metal-binding domain-containing protein [Paenibacillus hodogayensis]|uniref:SEC-C metal-binding domain-containing protein n=1 Tax=Paenibacillus hodogayensis TaxID=279208 RepID=A0ABV5VVK3_9BACL
MNKKSNGSNQQALVDALQQLKSEAKKTEAREEEKRWSPIDAPLSLEDGLSRLTKSDLSAIRSNWNIRGASTLKKQELIAVLEKNAAAALDSLWLLMDETQYAVMKKVADNGGQAFVSLEAHQLDYFQERGMLFAGTYAGEKTLIMPQEIVKLFRGYDTKQLSETARQNTETITLAQGMLHYYGMMSVTELLDRLKPLVETESETWKTMLVLEQASEYYRLMRIDGETIMHGRAWNTELIRKELEQRPTVSLYPFTKEQLLRAGAPGFLDRSANHAALVGLLLSHYNISAEEADSQVEDIVYSIRNGGALGSLMQLLQSRFEIHDLALVQQLMEHLVILYNATRQWILKGYAPSELSPSRNAPARPVPAKGGTVIDFTTRKKVGRNDPCPCGSGKKFKKCCGS